MLIGVDFDNTIVCYDTLFHKIAVEQGLIREECSPQKSAIRDRLRREGNEEAWTILQGYVYGKRMAEATPFPGVLDFFRACRKEGVDVYIVSHKTRYPYLGPRYDLHLAAQNWLHQEGFYDISRGGLPKERAFFEKSKQEKIERIASLRCTHFIDDLPEFLSEEAFPSDTDRILFSTEDPTGGNLPFQRIPSWREIGTHLRLKTNVTIRPV